MMGGFEFISFTFAVVPCREFGEGETANGPPPLPFRVPYVTVIMSLLLPAALKGKLGATFTGEFSTRNGVCEQQCEGLIATHRKETMKTANHWSFWRP